MLCVFVAFDDGVGVVVVDGFEVFAADGIPADAVFVFHFTGKVADDVFDELGVVVGGFSDVFFVGAFEDGEDLGAGAAFDNVEEFFDPHGLAFAEADLGGHVAALVVGAVF